MKKTFVFIFLLAMCSVGTLLAKDSAVSPAVSTLLPNYSKRDSSKDPMETMKMDGMMDMGSDHSVMTSGFSLNLPMNRDGSGTGWLPDAAPMRAIMYMSGKWQFMTHFNIFLRYNNQDVFREGSRGGAKFDAPNMGMFMAQHPVGKNGLFHFSVMASLDPITVRGNGYPLIYQTGESWKGTPLVDHQHPHDLFSEVAVSYTEALTKHTDLYVYLGYPGEPALGPVTYMHRPSGMYGPDAPIGHHWQDATHIQFGVATLGFRVHDIKLEGSSFTGREPDENRYNFDRPRFDSYSGRVSYNPTKNWALQVSRGYLKSPEALRPDENVNRTTASANYASEFLPDKFFTANLVWGLNQIKGQSPSNAIGLEGAVDLKENSFYARYEWIKKSTAELVLPESTYGNTLFALNAVTLGFNQKVYAFGRTNLAMGAQTTLNIAPSPLAGLYGKTPIGAEVFIRIFPMRMGMKGMAGHSMH